MGRCYNVVCDSSFNVSQPSIGQTTYYFDWSKLRDDKMYKVRFSYMSDDTTTTLSPVMTIFHDFNAGGTTYQAGNGTSNIVGLLGNVFADKHGANAYYSAKYTDNPPLMMYKPTNNFFTITFRNGLTAGSVYSTPAATSYVLMINFEETDDDY